MKKKQQFLAFAIGLTLLALTSCDNVGLMSNKNSLLPNEINSFGDVLIIYVVISVSTLLIALLLSIPLGEAGFLISLLLHFIWVVNYRDYGFFPVLLLFVLLSRLPILIDKLKKLS